MKNSSEQFEALRIENQQLKTHQQHLAKQVEQYQQAYESLQTQIQNLLRDRFGQRSERDIDPNNPQVDFLLDEKNYLLESRMKRLIKLKFLLTSDARKQKKTPQNIHVSLILFPYLMQISSVIVAAKKL